ncbi:unnamed protein product [Rotaria sp. Silwood2]|nr:unnamed protein product [Rotaria sp. Silwood2]CAF2803616.1 unnamed protein product [Rotaria sp. Silwood2]CAF3196705.1 unnamed protein product [Rotaria sp. Silwood2]CAF4107731.1 unnamed protein product [Rotaria sp. Silwood2]CAF4285611.1 unnamed protein product [Rotaria sp. Silwood2]
MFTSSASSSNTRTFDPTALPPRWLDCPRKSTIIADKFIAFKTPLDDQFKEKIGAGQRWTCSMLVDSVKREQKNIGIIIDLTNTDRFYKSDVEFKDKNIRYEKIRCRGHGETPSDEQINRFIKICNDFLSTNPNDIIGIHCTHGFNRTGFLICAYLCLEHDIRYSSKQNFKAVESSNFLLDAITIEEDIRNKFISIFMLFSSIDATIDMFSKARPPGIYKQDYLNELLKKYGDASSTTIPAPARPEWCLTNSDDEDEPNERPVGTGGIKRPRNNIFEQSNKRFREEPRANSNPQFAVSLPGVIPICLQSAMATIQLKCQRLCEWNRRGFPGSQPVSMDITNYMTIVQSPYMVSWKADGTRYMMLIEDENKIYMFDRDNNVFEISHLRFPKDPECTSHLTNTLIDGELVIDNVNGMKVPRYLIYDVVVYENENVGKKPFRERLDIIRRLIVDVRNKAITKGLIDRSLDPFSIRNKDFWDLSTVHKLVGAKFQAQIAHEVDGLIFQPELDPYIPGRSPRVLKWKEDNTIDFRLKICVDRSKLGQLPEKKAFLYVNGMQSPFATMPYSSDLRQYDNQIIECSYRDGQWHFHRQRTDKSFPNAKGMFN